MLLRRRRLCILIRLFRILFMFPPFPHLSSTVAPSSYPSSPFILDPRLIIRVIVLLALRLRMSTATLGPMPRLLLPHSS